MQTIVPKQDAACMAVPWLVCIGFVLVYSALLAKMRRIKEIMTKAQRFRRAEVPRRKVVMTIACFLSAMLVILITWQLVSPLIWVREVTDTNPFTGYPTGSIGRCESEHFAAFAGTCSIFMAFCLVYALVSPSCVCSTICHSSVLPFKKFTQLKYYLLGKVLCYQTRNMPIEFSESKYVSISFLLLMQE